MYRHPTSKEGTRANVGLDAVLKTIKSDFEQKVTWLGNNVYLRAHRFLVINAELQDNYLPVAYMGNGEHVDLRPDDSVESLLFFMAKDPEKTNFDKKERGTSFRSPILANRSVSLIFWCDLTKINPSYKADYNYTESIKKEFVGVLRPHVKSIDEIYDDNIDNVYNGFTLTANMLDRNPYKSTYSRNPRNDRKQYNKHPNAYLRIDFTLEYFLDTTIC